MRSAQAETIRVSRPCEVRGNRPARLRKVFLADSIAADDERSDKALWSLAYNESEILA